MKTSFKILGTLVALVALLVSAALYNFFVLGQPDFGLMVSYSYCENEIFSFDLPGQLDRGFRTYYDAEGMAIGACYPTVDDECRKMRQTAGICKEHGFPLFKIPFLSYIWSAWLSLNQEPGRSGPVW